MFRIKYQKSKALDVALPSSLAALLWVDFPFKWATSHIKYLGILLPSRAEEIFPLNFPPSSDSHKEGSSGVEAWPVFLVRTLWHSENDRHARAVVPLSSTPHTGSYLLPKSDEPNACQFCLGPETPTVGANSSTTSKTEGRHSFAGCQSLPYAMSPNLYLGLVSSQRSETMGASRTIPNRGPAEVAAPVSDALVSTLSRSWQSGFQYGTQRP